MGANMATDVHIFHFLANSYSSEGHDIQIFEGSPHIVPVVYAVGWVTASRSPMGRVALDGLHTGMRQAVHLEAFWSVLLDGSILGQTFQSKTTPVLVAPGHDKGPGIARFTLHITVHGKTIAAVVVDLVNATFGDSFFLEVVEAGGWSEFHLWWTRVTLKRNQRKIL